MFTTQSQFHKPAATEQTHAQIVDVSNWSIGDLTPYSEGARDKALLESPRAASWPFIIPNHKYLLKRTYAESTGTILYEQFWNEIIAYKLGRALGVAVPPAFVAHYQRAGEPFYGSLIEWFYDYGTNDESLRGGHIITRYIQGYDTKKGERHNFQTLEQIFTTEQVENWLHDLTKILLFDAIIGNTDRHQDNWQIINYSLEQKRLLSPAFDNGTSMGYKIRNDHLDGWLNKLPKMAKNGYHHMKWQIDDAAQANHFELLQLLIAKHSESKAVMLEVLAHDIAPAFEQIAALTKFDLQDARYKLSHKRADFIIKFLQFRYNHAKELLDI